MPNSSPSSSTCSRGLTRTAPSSSSSTVGALDVVLVGDLADDLLEDVLDRDQAGGAAVLVDDDRDVGALCLHLAQQVVDRLGVGHEHAPAASRESTALDRLAASRLLVDPPRRRP